MSATLHLATRFPLLFPDDVAIQCGDGWTGLLERLFADLEAYTRARIDAGEMAPDAAPRVVEVKQKLGGLRVYLRRHVEDMEQRIAEAEDEALRTCDVCGQPGELRDYKGLYATRCGRHGPHGRVGKPVTEPPSIRFIVRTGGES